MDIQTRKIEFIKEFLKLQSDEMISIFENILKSENISQLQPMSADELHKRIEQSEKDFENGDFKSHKDVFSKYRQ